MPTPKNPSFVFAQQQKKLFAQMAFAQSQALNLAKYLESNLSAALQEGLSVPGRGAGFAMNTLGEFSTLLGNSLTAITETSNCLMQAGTYLANANTKRAEAGHYIMKNIGPKLQSASKGLMNMGNTITSFSEKLPAGQFKDCVTLFAGTMKAVGTATNGILHAFEIAAKLDATIVAPAIETLTTSIHRAVETLHSAAESIREFCQGLHLKCDSLANKLNINPDSKANKTLNRLSTQVANTASNFLWSMWTSPKNTPDEDKPTLTTRLKSGKNSSN